eukprot:Gb_18742 [translate_table: standard]
MNFYAVPFVFIFLVICHCQEFSYDRCSAGRRCGNSILKYPFDCVVDGFDFQAHCSRPDIDNQQYTITILDGDGLSGYRIVDDLTESSYVNQTITVRVVYVGLSMCSSIRTEKLGSIPTGFNLSHEDTINGTVLLDCEGELPERLSPSFQRVACPHINCHDNKKGYCDNNRKGLKCFFSPNNLNTGLDLSALSCNPYGLIVPKNYNLTAMQNDLRQYLLTVGFRITWTKSPECQSCERSHGICAMGYNISHNWDLGFVCVHPNGMHEHNCSGPRNPLKPIKVSDIHSKHSKWSSLIIILGISLGVVLLSITLVAIFFLRELRKSQRNYLDLRLYMDSMDSRPVSVENFLQGYASGPTRYSYRQIRKYTNNFTDKLGQGGFGQVFRGKLPNGSLVAVKLLDISRQSAEQQFLNEVATIGRIHHFHLVRLLGYCFQKSKRALVYEYMINGSLEKYIHGSQDTHPNHALDWKQLYSIAIGTARGIAYLHEECANRILHCDIKPHNVLLDANYSPRVSDFGLAKLGKREESHIYGMLLLEMVGGRKNLDVGGNRSSQFYFPKWAFTQIEKGEFGRLRMPSEVVGGINGADDENIAKKLALIGLSCIHYDSSHRPSMVKVIQMLEGSVQVTTPSLPFPAYVPTPPASLPGESSSYSF